MKKKEERKNTNQMSKKSALYNTENLYDSQEGVNKFFDDYSLMIHEAKNKATKWEGLKILISKQMLQSLPLVLTQVKADNNAEYLLNRIR